MSEDTFVSSTSGALNTVGLPGLCNIFYRLLEMVRESFGNDAARNVMSVEPDNLPIILIVFKSKGQVEVRNAIQGT